MVDDDSDFADILEGTVDEVKDRIRDLDSPDYEGLLEAEEDGKDRKTVKEFLQSRIDSGEDEENESEDIEVEDPEDMVRGIEEETEGGILGSFSRESVLAGGLILGLVIGFAAAGLTSGATAQANPQQIQENVRTIAGAGGNVTVEVSPPEIRHSMYHMNVTISQPTENGTATQTREVYTTLDGRYLFLVQRQFGQLIRPVDIPQTLDRLEQQQEQGPTAPGDGQSPTGNTTQ